MAFALNGLYQIGPGGVGPRLWMYQSSDAIADVNTSGYFDDASDLLGVRDVIICVDDTTPATHLVSVTTIIAGVVDVSDGLAITETDTD